MGSSTTAEATVATLVQATAAVTGAVSPNVDLRIKGTAKMSVRAARKRHAPEAEARGADGGSGAAPAAAEENAEPLEKRPRGCGEAAPADAGEEAVGKEAQAKHEEEEVMRWVRAAPLSASASFSVGAEGMCRRLLKQSPQKLKIVLQTCARRRANGDPDLEVLLWMEGVAVAILAKDYGVHVRMTLEGGGSKAAEAEVASEAAVKKEEKEGAEDLKAAAPPLEKPPALLRAPSWGLGCGGAPKQTLRISAGRAAAAAGIHPYADVGEVFLELLYQDLPELLLKDSALAGAEVISVVDERTRLLAKSGEAAALEEAVSRGASSVGLEELRSAKRDVGSALATAERAARLNSEEVAQLRDTLEGEINCGFGARHEDVALEAYEARVGTRVYGAQHRIKVPLPCGGPEEALARSFPPTGSGCRAALLEAGGAASGPAPEPYFYLTGFTDAVVDLPRPRVLPPQAEAASPQAAADGGADGTAGAGDRAGDGAVGDGGAGCPDTETLIVEVKHRMGRIQDNPNIYDIVQLCSYCRVLGCARGDLVQCLRDGPALAGGSVGELHVTRLDFSEGSPHRVGWDRHVLPGLYQAARAVYAARDDEATRLRLLAASPEERKKLVGDLCPHLGG